VIRRPHPDTDQPANKENVGDLPPSKRRRGRNALYSVIADHEHTQNERLAEARALDEKRQGQVLERLDRVADGLAALAEISKDQMARDDKRREEQSENQMQMMQMILNAAVGNHNVVSR